MTENHYFRSNCRICSSKNLHRFLDLGKTPLADAFVTRAQIDKGDDPYFPLAIYVCEDCNHMQLLDVVNPRLLFPEEYALFSSFSPAGAQHFKDYAEELSARFGETKNKLAVEIASNDGVMLAPLKNLGFSVLGVEPASNTAAAARTRGVEVVEKFFSEELSAELVRDYGKAGLVIANNVLAHVDEPLDFVRGVKNILDEEGVFAFEVQYGLELIKKTEFDNIYHEHLSFFALRPLSLLMEKCGMKIFDIKRVTAQGGSLRCFATHAENDSYSTTKVPADMKAAELEAGLGKIATYDEFGQRALAIRSSLQEMIRGIKQEGKKIVGYGAPAKGNTLLNFCGIGPEWVDYCIEKTPFKFGKFTPGMHIPVVSDEVIKKDGEPDFYLLLIWNYLDAILDREKDHTRRGGKFIVPVPSPALYPRSESSAHGA